MRIGIEFVKCMCMINIMRTTHLRTTDLNLLLGLTALIEERSVSRAADRFGLSQPAMSRVLQRLRETFEDELLVRTPHGYEPTMRARRIMAELEDILPRLDLLVRGGAFAPAKAEETFRISCTDYATVVLGPRISTLMFNEAPNVSLNIAAWHDEAFEDCIAGRLDAVLWVNDVPDPLICEKLFTEDFVCVLSADHDLADKGLTLESYLAYPHVTVDVLSGQQTLVEERLKSEGLRRQAGLRVPYFAAAVNAVPQTNLIATVPRRIARLYSVSNAIKIVPAPIELPPFDYVLGWHPRATDDAAHRWMRGIFRQAAE